NGFPAPGPAATGFSQAQGMAQAPSAPTPPVQAPLRRLRRSFSRPAAGRPRGLHRSGASPCLQAALVTGRSDVLGAVFDDLFSVVAQLVALACLAWLVAYQWRGRGWLMAPFLVAMALFLVLLPMDYGALQRPTIYPVVRFAMKDGSTA